MFNTHDKFTYFYNNHIKLDNEIYDQLREYRDKNLERVENGLAKLEQNKPIKNYGQGSYSMGTMVRQPNNDYDIDHAIIFRTEDLPEKSLDARTHVINALNKSGDAHLFSEPPTRRTNAVTVWYKDGYHIDLAVYRCSEDIFGNETIEHAGSIWRKRHPVAMNTWFSGEVKKQSPKPGITVSVAEKQMQRIVQFLKMFTKARSENLPGGLIISVLVSECYVPDNDRDDIALVETMRAICDRTSYNTHVWNPVDTEYELTDKDEPLNQVKNLHQVLDKALEWLAPLFDSDCDETIAYRAWNKVFKHEYWDALLLGLESVSTPKFVSSTGSVTVSSTKPSTTHVESPPHKYYGDK